MHNFEREAFFAAEAAKSKPPGMTASAVAAAAKAKAQAAAQAALAAQQAADAAAVAGIMAGGPPDLGGIIVQPKPPPPPPPAGAAGGVPQQQPVQLLFNKEALRSLPRKIQLQPSAKVTKEESLFQWSRFRTPPRSFSQGVN
eukprot:g3599.t1